MMYLENVLKDMNPKANVLVYLSSSTKYDNGMVMRDHCGNHQVKNFLRAICSRYLGNKLIVKSVDISFYDYMDAPQWEVVLENTKDEDTDALKVVSNAFAFSDALYNKEV